MGGHPLSWSLFFCDNIIKKQDLNEYEETSKCIEPDIKSNVSPKQHNITNPVRSVMSGLLKPREKNTPTITSNTQTNQIQINDSTPFMSIDVWIKLSHVVIDASYKNGKSNYDYKDEIAKAFKNENPIIFLKTDLLPNYIDILNSFNKGFILITASNDDHCPPYLYYPANDDLHKDLQPKVDQLLNSRHLVMWYAKNPAIQHIKLKPYPLGPKWQWKTTRFFGEDKIMHQTKNTECGVYCLYFIITLLTGENDWKRFITRRITDEEIMKYRDIYFNSVI